jgi:translation initiation factor 2B subunit (eIF-2B alpha/beta/delta family)/8-oxo-dGTP pyrophosphatase MutT (NUDIX family)
MSELVPVVTAFVHSGERIALIKRSRQVGTYKGAWAAFSGYVEQMPLEQAYTELLEEAGLSPVDIDLCGMGVPLPVDDIGKQRSWLVLPFLFRLRDGAEIRTDWEAEEWRWHRPDDFIGMDTVPGLAAALDRVWPMVGDAQFWAELGAVATDKVHGATELARKGLQALGGYVQDRSEMLNHDDLVRSIRAFAASRPTMGVFPDLAARLLLAMDREGGQFDFDALVTELLGMIDDASDVSVDKAARALAGKSRVLTLSHSEVVRRALLKWHHGENEVLVAESFPGGEGVTLAEELRDEDVNVRVIRDSDVPSASAMVDAVIIGCDAITVGDEVVNKVGTAAAVGAAKQAGVPRLVVAQTFKVLPPEWPFFLEQWAGAGACGHSDHVRVGTVIFDKTPLGDFDAVITEEGVLSLDRLAEIREQLASVELMP